MNILTDIINVNKEALRRTLKSLKYLPLLAIVILGLNIAEFWIQTLLISSSGGVNFLLGFARYIVTILFGSALIGILYDLVKYNRFRINALLDGYKTFFGPFSSVMFIYILIEYAFLFLNQIMPNIFGLFILLGIQSVLYEEVYIANKYSVEAYSNLLRFFKENILHWLIPMIFYNYLQLRMRISGLAIFNLNFFIRALIFSIFLAFIYLYKGHLFSLLYNSSRRKREFEGKF